MQRTPPELTQTARQLRSNATPAERALWHAIRNHRPRFTRQLVVSHYVVDIACRSLKLAIELDGGHHGDQIEADARRTAYLAANGWTVLRFWNNDVSSNLEGVVRTITETASHLATHPQPHP